MTKQENAITRFWDWYKRIGTPVEFYTSLSPKACIERLNAETVGWDTRNPFGMKKYKSLILYDGRFKLKNRRIATERPFEGKLEQTSQGGTRITGQVVNDTSFLGFVSALAVGAPVVGALVYGRVGVFWGVVIGVLFLIAALYARYAEEKSHSTQALQIWLMDVLHGSPRIIDMEASKSPSRKT